MRVVVIIGLSVSLTGCISVGAISPAAPFVPDPSAPGLPTVVAMQSVVAQAKAYGVKLEQVRQGRQFNLYFTVLSATGGLISTAYDLHKDTIKGWALASGLGFTADKASNLATLQKAYESGISKLGCISREAQPFMDPLVRTQENNLAGAANYVRGSVNEAEIAIASGGVASDDPLIGALRAAITKAQASILRSDALIGAIYGAPATVVGAAGTVDDQVIAAQRGAEVDLKALVDQIVALKTAQAPSQTPAPSGAAPAGQKNAAAPGGPGPSVITAAEYIRRVSAAAAVLDGVNGRIDYVAARERILGCATKA